MPNVLLCRFRKYVPERSQTGTIRSKIFLFEIFDFAPSEKSWITLFMKLFRSVYVTLVNLAHVEPIIRRAQIHHQIYLPPVSLSDNDFSNQAIEVWENHTCYQKKKCNRMADMLIFRKLLLLDRKRFILFKGFKSVTMGSYNIILEMKISLSPDLAIFMATFEFKIFSSFEAEFSRPLLTSYSL